MKKIVIFILILTLQNLFGENKWTVLGYFDGDQLSNDCGVSTTMSYLTELDSIENIDIVIQADRYPGNSPGIWSDTRRFKIEHFERDDYDFNEVCVDSTLGELNMGSMETLRDFLIWGVNTYPSERYILILKDHGAGWGICTDETNIGILSIKDIRNALDGLFISTGVNIDILAFDACSMGIVEIAYELHERVNASFIFSQDVGYTPTLFNLRYIISRLNNDPDMNSRSATELFFSDVPSSAITLSAVDSEMLPDLASSISDFSDSFGPDSAWGTVEDAYRNSISYDESHIDMLQFFSHLAGSGISEAGDVVSVLEQVIIANHTRDANNTAGGLSVFFDIFFNRAIALYNTTAFFEASSWNDFISNYGYSFGAFESFLYISSEPLPGYWTLINNDDNRWSWGSFFINTRDEICDDYLITPKINICRYSVFKFKAKGGEGDRFDIRLSQEGNADPEAFNTVLLENVHTETDWTEYSVVLDKYFNEDIFLSIRCTSSGGEFITLDSLELSPISEDVIPVKTKLFQNYPNPFNPTTTIQYSLPAKEHVKISVFNSIGEKVAELVNEIQKAGYNSVNFDGTKLPSGEYFYKLESSDDAVVKRMLLLK